MSKKEILWFEFTTQVFDHTLIQSSLFRFKLLIQSDCDYNSIAARFVQDNRSNESCTLAQFFGKCSDLFACPER